MTVREIVKEYLKANGYTGLAGDDCGCEISDLMPCDSEVMDCEPGYKHFCQKCPAKNNCDMKDQYDEDGDGRRWCISIEKDIPKKGDK